MRLLLDENLSFRLCHRLATHFDEVRHVRDFDLLQTDDRLIWNFAKAEGFAIVTQDQDFVGRVIVDGAPPKVVWIRLGDAAVKRYADLLRDGAETITAFLRDPDAAFLELPSVPLV